MNTKILVSAILMAALPLTAQQQTLITGDLEHGGFGGPRMQLSNFGDDLGVLTGGHGGWIINHVVYIGGGGYGLANGIDMTVNAGEERRLNVGYGGMEVGIILASDRMVHATVSVLAGGGGADFTDKEWDGDWRDESTGDPFWVVEPSAHVVLNVVKFMRVGVGASYRYTKGFDLEGLPSDYMDGGSVSLELNFGQF